MSIDISGDLPLWKQKLQYSAQLYRSCSQEGRIDDFLVFHSVSHVSDSKLTANDRESLKAKHGKFYLLRAAAPSGGELDDPDKEMLKGHMRDVINSHEAIPEDVQALTDELKAESNPDKPAWQEKLEESRQKSKDKATEIIDKSYDDMEILIAKLPEDKRELAVDFWDNLLSMFLKFWQDVWNGIVSVVQAVVEWLAEMWEKIKNAFIQVGRVFTNIWNWITGA